MSASTTRSAPEQIPQSLRQPVMADGSAPAGQDGKKHKGSIRRRLIVLCAFQILLVLASTMFLTRQIAEVAEYQARNVQLVSKAKLANSAQRTFGELKYWLSDLAVSLLVESESRAKDAQADLKVQLDELSRHDAETVLAMRTSLDVMIRQAYLAVDAYTNNTRVLGNSHMSTARIHIAKIDALLEAIVSRAEFDAYALENTVETKISEARVVGFAILIGGVLIGLAVAFYFLLSITRPLRELAVATIEVSNDYRNAEIPENSPAEIAVMADSLRRFRDNLIERDRLLEERAQSESQAEKARRLFRAFLDNAQTAFLLRRPEGEYILANKQWHEWFNQSGEEMEGLDVRGQSGSIEKESLDRHDEEVIGGRTSITREIDATLKDGSAKRFFMQKFPVTDENDAVVAIGMTFADITELRETERELVEQSYRAQEALEANAAMTEFLTNMSHELRTPLNAIIGFADVLSKGGENEISQDYRDFAGDILLSGQHLLDMINDLLDSAKIEKGEFVIEPERISLRGEIEDSIGLIEPQAAARSLLIETKLDGISEDTILMADRRCFRQIILNLMSNAEKFSDSGSPIIVSAAVEDSGLVFSVQDFGIGISAEYLEQVFDRFAQVEGGLQRKRGGTGIGLSISRALAELHGGTLTLESEEGKGTTAILRLPESVTTAPAEKSPEIEAKPATGTGPGRPLRILVAEDHKINQAVIRSILGELGHQVEIVGTGKEALAAVLRSPFDLIFMDMQMPGMDGLEATRRLRQLNEATARLPVIALTANARKEHRVACFDAGMSDYLPKPIKTDAVDAIIRKWAPLREEDTGGASVPTKNESGTGDDPAYDSDQFDQYLRLVGAVSVAALIDELRKDTGIELAHVRDASADGDNEKLVSHILGLKGAFANVGARRLRRGRPDRDAGSGRRQRGAADRDR